MFKEVFRKRKYLTLSAGSAADRENKIPFVPDGIWSKCPVCGEGYYFEDIEDNFCLCRKCGFHFRMGARERIKITFDSFEEKFEEIKAKDPISFPDYPKKIDVNRSSSSIDEAVITGIASIKEMTFCACIMDSTFMMGSMGTAVGEKIAKTAELALKRRLPLIIFTASGGARMQEGIFSLMQMAKISAVISKLDEERILYISVLTDPTMGGVTASFAMQADIILSEPGASIGFAGKRVIEKTIKETLPPGFQKAEFLKERGFIDEIINRKNLKEYLYKLLLFHKVG
ncbi:acetyl-CoA carboxylase, carboxyltransferase subunit beta [Clostridium polynesiense]|uniref:acetyl-CoA carboxylase, carboxyltransferase subunit beta n=1 Tax=Clostridium polynesiense TaxID=1325933 RepID=UPI00058B97B5|nr:acetyl-CoA carboxylase, carboxyltransferase subunit beta [Clostridium polynesiense]